MNKQFDFDTKAPLHNFISTTGGTCMLKSGVIETVVILSLVACA